MLYTVVLNLKINIFIKLLAAVRERIRLHLQHYLFQISSFYILLFGLVLIFILATGLHFYFYLFI